MQIFQTCFGSKKPIAPSLLATEIDGLTPSIGLFLVATVLQNHSSVGVDVSFLIDTGSSLSILPISFKPDNTSHSFTLRTANGSVVKTAGTSTFNFTLPHFPKPFSWTFQIADVTHPILGADFLCANSISVDCKARRLSISGTLDVCAAIAIPPLDVSSFPTFVQKLFHEFPSLISPDTSKTKPVTHHYFHSIATYPTPPLRERVRILSNEKLDFVRAEFAELLNSGIVRRSASPWAAPIHVVTKKDGSFRLCGDYRRLNQVTIPDTYPMPLIHDVLKRLPNATIFSTLDLRKAYHQIPVAPEDISKTAVITPCGLFEYLFMPFGLRNAAQTFQRHIHNILEKLPFSSFSISYIDDILVGSKDPESHELHIRQIFEALSKFNLCINVSKCSFSKPEVKFLGHSISAKGIRPLPRRAEVITKFPLPKTVSQLRSFLGTVNYCHRFIPNLSSVSSPLSALCSGPKHSDISWTDKSLKSFEDTKQSLANMETLHFPKSGLPLTLTTDASDVAAGAVLHQINNGISEPLEFFSKKFDSAQQKYSAFDRELSAIAIAIKHFKYLLEGRSFTIFTDHKPLLHISNMKDPTPRQLRQINFISQFSCEIKHIAGRENIIADCFSRCTNALIHQPLISTEQLLDNPPSLDDLSHFKDNFRIENGIHFDTSLSGTLRPILGSNLRRPAFDAIHNLHHPGTSATFLLLRNHVIWPSMRRDIKLWVSECLDCQRFKIHKHTKPPLIHFPTGNRFDTVHLDIVGPLPPSHGFTYLFTMIDRKTRWFEVIPLRNITAETIAKNFLNHWISRYGVPLTIITDRGTQFESGLLETLTSQLNIKRLRTTSYHPQTNGLLERFHRTLKTSLGIHSNSYQWSESLPYVLLGWRNTPSKTTGCSPAQLLFGCSISPPDKLVDFNNDFSSLELSAARDHFLALDSNPLFSTSHGYKPYVPTSFETASHVWIRKITDSSLKPRYFGPFPLISLKNNVAFVDVDGSHQTISLARLKPAFGITTEEEPYVPLSFPPDFISLYDSPKPKTPLEIGNPPIAVPAPVHEVRPSSPSSATIPAVDSSPIVQPFLRTTSSTHPHPLPSPIPEDTNTGISPTTKPVLRPLLRHDHPSRRIPRSVSINPWVRERTIDQPADTPTRLHRVL